MSAAKNGLLNASEYTVSYRIVAVSSAYHAVGDGTASAFSDKWPSVTCTIITLAAFSGNYMMFRSGVRSSVRLSRFF